MSFSDRGPKRGITAMCDARLWLFHSKLLIAAHVSSRTMLICSRSVGVLVLSEFAGAAQSLGAGAILVNPWNITDLAAAIKHSLTMR